MIEFEIKSEVLPVGNRNGRLKCVGKVCLVLQNA